MSPLPPELREAIAEGQITEAQLWELIALEARAIGLSADEAVDRARSGRLPKNYIADDLALLVELLPVPA